MGKQDSWQRLIISQIKYETKKDLNYMSFVDSSTGKKVIVMDSPRRRYGTTFSDHVNAWVDIKLNHQTPYDAHVSEKDKIVVQESIDKWIRKMNKVALFY